MSERKAHWERVYRDKSPQEVSWYQAEPGLSLRLIEQAVADPDAAIIDVGGGASLLVDRLLARGYRQLTVLDLAASALEHTRARLGARAAEVDWQVADVTAFRPPRRYRLWHDRAVFHFLTAAEDRRRYVATLREALEVGGSAVIAAFAIGGPERCSGLPIVQYDAAKLAAELGEGFELVEQATELHRTPAGGEQAFGYFWFRRLR